MITFVSDIAVFVLKRDVKLQLGIPNPDNYFQTLVSGLDALIPEFRVQVWVLQI